jgi:ubiquinone/menaquinone biosynthesis C-methylase UbiE
MKEPKSSYIGRHAELYDLFYAEKPYEDEVAFIHTCLQVYKPDAKKILELACGTGNHSLLLENYGYQIIASDYSSDMLTQALKKAQKKDSRVEFRRQDMRTLDVPERPFDAIICLFDSIGYVSTNENIETVLKNVHTHLCPDGLFIFEFWHAGAMLRNYDPLRIRRWQTPEGEILRISETNIEYKKQLCHVAYSIYELNKNGSYYQLQETQSNRFFLLKEMESFLINSGLMPIKWFSGFQNNELINDETWHVVAVAQKQDTIK